MGFVGSSARHYELGPIGLALVKRNVPVEAVLSAEGWRRARRSWSRRTRAPMSRSIRRCAAAACDWRLPKWDKQRSRCASDRRRYTIMVSSPRKTSAPPRKSPRPRVNRDAEQIAWWLLFAVLAAFGLIQWNWRLLLLALLLWSFYEFCLVRTRCRVKTRQGFECVEPVRGRVFAHDPRHQDIKNDGLWNLIGRRNPRYNPKISEPNRDTGVVLVAPPDPAPAGPQRPLHPLPGGPGHGRLAGGDARGAAVRPSDVEDEGDRAVVDQGDGHVRAEQAGGDLAPSPRRAPRRPRPAARRPACGGGQPGRGGGPWRCRRRG